MLARSLAWQFLKQFGLKRPRVTIIAGECPATQIDIKYRRPRQRINKVARGYRSLSYRKKPSLA